jgi:hypothetical protein
MMNSTNKFQFISQAKLLEDHPLLALSDSLFRIFAATLYIPLNMDTFSNASQVRLFYGTCSEILMIPEPV